MWYDYDDWPLNTFMVFQTAKLKGKGCGMTFGFVSRLVQLKVER